MTFPTTLSKDETVVEETVAEEKQEILEKIQDEVDLIKEEASGIESLPIRLVRVYQAVTFDKANETSFLIKGNTRKKPCSVSINKDLIGLEIKNESDHIFVPMANVACIHFDCEASKEVEDAKAKEASRSAAQSASLTDKSKKPR